jgi:beta-hydroxylase
MNSQAIRHELDGVLESKIRLPLFHEISPEQKNISKGDNWKTFVFYILGEPYLPNCQLCPDTALQLARIPKLKNAMFSILEPHYHIPPHQGPTKGVIRVHLGLKIPSDKKQCRIRVENHILTWEEGQCIVFDDFFEHEAWNDTDEQRIVLFLDVERPMRLTGRLLNRVLFAIGRRSVFIRDAYKKLHRLEHKQTN